MDDKSQRFVGSGAEIANPYLRRDYRAGFEVPQYVENE
jgi:hypothetical protein